MSSHKALYLLAAGAAALVVAACSDRPDRPPAVTAPAPGPDAAASAGASPVVRAPEGLARQFARALANPDFRAYLKAALDASPYREHKLQFQAFLGRGDRRALRYLAEENGTTEDDVARDARAAIPVEVYLPVPAHRAAWRGDENVLVATAIRDRDVPVAFDVQGRRQLLDPDTPPATPVIALVPVETDFTPRFQRAVCLDCDGGGGGGGGGEGGGGDGGDPDIGLSPPAPPASGLYMTKAHFVQTFESWLKGSPEFEVHILGQKGATDSLTSYQCAGEHAGGPYTFDQNALDWSGSVLLFSQQQINDYNSTHPGQNMRVFVVEDDDTACEIKTGQDRFKLLISAVDGAYQSLTAGNDSSSTVVKLFKHATALKILISALASLILTNDDLLGNAVEDAVVGESYPGFNWVVKGDNNVTNGWINLVMY